MYNIMIIEDDTLSVNMTRVRKRLEEIGIINVWTYKKSGKKLCYV